MNFTVEEINFICAVIKETKDDTVDSIFDILPVIQDGDMKNIAESVIEKLEKISETEFQSFDFKNNAV